MNDPQHKKLKRVRRHSRVRSKVIGQALRPRLAVFRANQHIYAQIIDDTLGKTLVSAASAESKSKSSKTAKAGEVGTLIAQRAKQKNIHKVVFDRGGFKYHGRIKALADAARAGGLDF